MRALTKLEAQLVERLKETVEKNGEGSSSPFGQAFVAEMNGPGLQVGLQLNGSSKISLINVLVYGTRPVRYHIEYPSDPMSSKARFFWNKLLGPLNLVEEKSGERQGKWHLFYEVCYPDKELKQLGER